MEENQMYFNNMPQGYCKGGNIWFYSLQPGDATLYQFGMNTFEAGWARKLEFHDDGGFCDSATMISRVLSIYEQQENYIGIITGINSNQGYVIMHREELEMMDSYFVENMAKKYGIYKHWLASVLLACQVLAKNEMSVSTATKQMLKANLLLNDAHEIPFNELDRNFYPIYNGFFCFVDQAGEVVKCNNMYTVHQKIKDCWLNAQFPIIIHNHGKAAFYYDPETDGITEYVEEKE